MKINICTARVICRISIVTVWLVPPVPRSSLNHSLARITTRRRCQKESFEDFLVVPQKSSLYRDVQCERSSKKRELLSQCYNTIAGFVRWWNRFRIKAKLILNRSIALLAVWQTTLSRRWTEQLPSRWNMQQRLEIILSASYLSIRSLISPSILQFLNFVYWREYWEQISLHGRRYQVHSLQVLGWVIHQTNKKMHLLAINSPHHFSL